MKSSYKKIFSAALLASVTLGFSSCDDWLDTPPQNTITEKDYFADADQLGAYAIRYYNSLFGRSEGWSIGSPYLDDNGTDNSVSTSANQNYFTADQWKTQTSGDLGFSLIRYCNFFFEQVLPKYEAGYYTTNLDMVKHYIGEMYFIRAYTYFARLQTYGDYPIITTVPDSENESLLAVGKRMPRNEVADFIISDLDKAIDLLKDQGFQNNNRINKQVAQLIKSRVALYEASYERYHKGSGRVPGDADWPGYSVHPGYTLDVEANVNKLLTESMDAAKAVADHITLAENTGVLDQENPASPTDINPYFDMYALKDMSNVSEILMWKAYGTIDGSAIVNGVSEFTLGGSGYGLLKGYVDNFLMANGLPIYAANSGYHGDVKLDDVKKDRDGRLQLFLFSESNWLPLRVNETEATKHFTPYIGATSESNRDVTGYRMRKGESFDKTQNDGGKVIGTQGVFIFRGTEALLNYIEAQYMKDGNINSTSDAYWRAIRTRAKVDPDYNKTIAATDMAKEAEGDWGAYSHGQLLSDKTLYNIRRERRCEFIGEGMRWDDLVRWCSMDQLKTNKFIPRGCNFWTEIYKYATDNGNTSEGVTWIEGPTDDKANISSRADGVYVCPFRVRSNNAVYDGYTWMEAHYNSPIAIHQMELLSPDGTVANTECYQTWGWATTANEQALK